MTDHDREHECETIPTHSHTFVISGVEVAFQSADEPVPIERLVAIVLSIATTNPGCKTHFFVKVVEGA